jgi:hypothetical protein
MQASRSAEPADYDTFTCQRCDFVMTLGNPVQRGHRFQRKADSNPVIADSR